MCGIAGMIGVPSGESLQKKLLETMKRRGPDGQGVFVSGDCTLLHSRLAVIDPVGGAQPMTHSNLTIVYNGELYNTGELRQELESLGHVFSDRSDTRVLLHAFSQWGENCLEKLNGIYAFAIWDERRKALFLARDRIGVKPLFFRHRFGEMLFASEIKTLLSCPGVKGELDLTGAAQILLLGPGRIPGSGVFRGIEELEPGCCGWYEEGHFRIRRYWKLRDREHRENLMETVAHTRHLVLDSIRRQMVSDVPVGTFLSGGLDSSLITAVCAGALQEKGECLPTFSLDYENNDRYFQSGKFQPESDTAYIHRMQEAFPMEPNWTVLSAGELEQALEEGVMARDLPGMADVDSSMLLFCRRIRKRVTVALSGECADEIFGGYPWYRDPAIRDQEGFPWAQNTLERSSLLAGDVKSKLNAQDFVREAYLATCRESDILPGNSPQEKRMKEMVNLNFAWFMQTLLDRKDRMSMYTSLEVRVPFCDYRIAEYLYGVPWEYKDYRGVEKGLLRHAMQGVLPQEVLYRKKSPYPKTFHPDYTQKIRQRLELVLQEADGPLFRIVDRKALRQLCDGEQPWPWYGQLMRSPQTMAYFLQLDRWLRSYGIDIAV